MEGAVVRAEEKVRVTEADAEAKIREAMEKESAAAKEKQELLSYISALQEQLKRFIEIFTFFSINDSITNTVVLPKVVSTRFYCIS